jgi:hypothetical protein
LFDQTYFETFHSTEENSIEGSLKVEEGVAEMKGEPDQRPVVQQPPALLRRVAGFLCTQVRRERDVTGAFL